MKEQIIKLMEAEGLSPARFADEIGVQRSNVSHILSDRNKPGYDFIIKILKRFSGLNAEWLLTGKGSMIKNEKSEIGSINREPTIFDQERLIKNTDPVKKPDNKSFENQIVQPTSTQKENIKFTNVNSINYILVFYSDNSFEKFDPRR